MKIAFFDCQFGAAGDMLLAALLDAGLPSKVWLDELGKLALPAGSFTVSISDANRSSIAGKKVDVRCRDEKHERHLSDIAEIIEKSSISAPAKELSLKIFKRLADAEGKVHGIGPDQVHFHEVGAIDAIVDIAGFAIAYDLMGIEASFASPPPLGSGVVQTEHGLFPVPAPAVLNLLSEAGAPTRSSEIDYECLTPTGAAILTTVVESWGAAPDMESVNSTGYGAGSRDSRLCPNVLRVVIGRAGARPDRFASDLVSVIEANLDDSTPQAISFAAERLFQSGALDVSVIPAVMKKGRSGHVLSVVCKPSDRLKLQELILSETSSIGVRAYPASRLLAEREWQPVTLEPDGTVRIKIARDRRGRIVNAQPEYDDCAAYASRHGMAVKDVIAEAVLQYHLHRQAAGQNQG